MLGNLARTHWRLKDRGDSKVTNQGRIWVKSSTETPISISTPKGQNGDSAKPVQNSRSKNKTRNPKPKSHYIARSCLKQNKTKISKQNPLGTATQSKRKAE